MGRRLFLGIFALMIPAAVSAGGQEEAPQAGRNVIAIGEAREARFVLPANGEERRDYSIQLAQGESVRVDAESGTLDPELQLFEPGSSATKPIATNDDFGDGFNSRLRFVSSASGNYIIRVIARPDVLADEGVKSEGTISLSVLKDVAPPAPRVRTLSLGVKQEDRFALPDEAPDGEGFLHLYRANVTSPQRLIVSVSMQGLPSQIIVRRLDPTTGTERPVSSWLSREGTQVTAVAALEEAGDYNIRILSRQPGAYALTAQTAAVLRRPAQLLEVGQSYNGLFSLADQQTSDTSGGGKYLYHEWLLRGQAGQRVRVEMCSAATLDPLLQAVAPTVLGNRVILRNDDTDDDPACGSDTNSRLDLNFDASGTIRIWASPLRPKVGAYSIKAIAVPAGL